MVSKARDDFQEPETPVITTREFLGISIDIFLRLCVFAQRIEITSDIAAEYTPNPSFRKD
jgi:hypothetical protein